MSDSSQNPEWQILTCPACAGLFKVPRNRSSQGNQVKCPRCNTVTPVPAAADGETQRMPLTAAPAVEKTAIEEASAESGTATVISGKPGDENRKHAVEAAPEATSPRSDDGTKAIPQVRSFDPEAPLVRSRGKEGWEHQTPEPRNMDFKEKLARTTDAALLTNPDQPARIRRDWRREKAVAEMTGWETGAAGPSKTSRNRQRLLIAALGLCVAGLLAVVIKLLIFNNKLPDTGAGANAGPPAPATLEMGAAVDYRDQVWEAVRNFTSAATPDEMVPWIRERSRVEPLLRAHYAGGAALTPFESKRPPELSDLQAMQDYVVFLLELPDFTRRAIAVEKTPEGFRVDWESFTGYSEMPWAELQKQQPQNPVLIRAIMQPLDFLNFEGTSPTTHRCYRLTTPNGEETLYGYVKVKEKPAQDLQKAMLQSPSMHAVLKVRYPENSKSGKQVFITDFMIKGWILKKNGEAAEDPAAGVLGGN